MPTLDSITAPRTVAGAYEQEEVTLRGTGLDAAGLILRFGDRVLAVSRRSATEIVFRAPWEPDCAPPSVELAGVRVYLPDRRVLAVQIRPPGTAPEPPQPPTNADRAFALEVHRLTNVERANAGLAVVAASEEPSIPEDSQIGWWAVMSEESFEDRLALSVTDAAKAVAPVAEDASLTKAAQAHAEDQSRRGYFSHTTPPPENWSPFDRMRNAGWKGGYMSENNAMGHSSPAAVMSAWMGSAGHRANILAPQATHLGVGRFSAYTVMNFGGS